MLSFPRKITDCAYAELTFETLTAHWLQLCAESFREPRVYHGTDESLHFYLQMFNAFQSCSSVFDCFLEKGESIDRLLFLRVMLTGFSDLMDTQFASLINAGRVDLSDTQFDDVCQAKMIAVRTQKAISSMLRNYNSMAGTSIRRTINFGVVDNSN